MLLSDHQTCADALATIEAQLAKIRHHSSTLPGTRTRPSRTHVTCAVLQNVVINLRADLNLQLFFDQSLEMPNYKKREVYYADTE